MIASQGLPASRGHWPAHLPKNAALSFPPDAGVVRAGRGGCPQLDLLQLDNEGQCVWGPVQFECPSHLQVSAKIRYMERMCQPSATCRNPPSLPATALYLT